MKIRLTPQAGEDLKALSNYLKVRNPAVSIRVKDAIRASLQTIADHPQAGRLIEGGFRKHGVPRYPNLIFYSIDAKRAEIRVLSVRHAARDVFHPPQNPD